MYIVQDYSLAVIFCVVTMLCWGSWGNTQKLASKTWRYEFFYWDYVIGVLLFSLISGFTLGSIGTEGRSFLPDLAQANLASLGSAFLGGDRHLRIVGCFSGWDRISLGARRIG